MKWISLLKTLYYHLQGLRIPQTSSSIAKCYFVSGSKWTVSNNPFNTNTNMSSQIITDYLWLSKPKQKIHQYIYTKYTWSQYLYLPYLHYTNILYEMYYYKISLYPWKNVEIIPSAIKPYTKKRKI